MFLKNAWYVAAWSKDVGRELLGRVLLNEYVVLYRKEDGTPVALENRCPHRNLPLSEGRLIGDEIECGYHGMVYDCSGSCTHLPGSPTPPDWATVRTFRSPSAMAGYSTGRATRRSRMKRPFPNIRNTIWMKTGFARRARHT